MPDKPFPQTRLGDVATVSVGVTPRSAVRHIADGKVMVVQAKDLGTDGRLSAEKIVLSNLVFRRDQALRSGDVVIQSRGMNYRPALVPKGPGIMVAASPLYVIRLSNTALDPAFLVCILADATTQLELRREATGSHVPQIPRAAFDDLLIPLPPLDMQSAIVDATNRLHRERRFQAELFSLRTGLLRAAAFGLPFA